jgi:ABC-type branched-subunit amino acid transport system substrate-binding protein
MFSISCFAAEKILFAVVRPMTGNVAAAGIQMELGARLAVKEINESGITSEGLEAEIKQKYIDSRIEIMVSTTNNKE